jgi:aminopeptidase
MKSEILNKYAKLLVDYCLELKESDRVYIKTTLLAEPLVRAFYRYALQRGAHPVMDFSFPGQNKIFFEEANQAQLEWISPMNYASIKDFEAYLVIRAPFNLREDQGLDQTKQKIRSNATSDLNELYFKRTADRSLKRNLCQFPTQASAQEAGMSLEAYEDFIFEACRLYDPDPITSWLEVRKDQQHIVDHLNQCAFIQYKGAGIDISFSTKGRTWMNSDGQTNMPSGEVYTSPVETSVNGNIHFSYPSIFQGQPVEGITLWVENGEVVKWDARIGKPHLDKIFQIKGARYFGEAAIGTNYRIQHATKNILFDEKIGGTIHMAIGQSYFQTGGKNRSAIHWDMIADMKNGGEIWADGAKIYESGQFSI